jgi:hypothetical protein
VKLADATDSSFTARSWTTRYRASQPPLHHRTRRSDWPLEELAMSRRRSHCAILSNTRRDFLFATVYNERPLAPLPLRRGAPCALCRGHCTWPDLRPRYRHSP